MRSFMPSRRALVAGLASSFALASHRRAAGAPNLKTVEAAVFTIANSTAMPMIAV